MKAMVGMMLNHKQMTNSQKLFIWLLFGPWGVLLLDPLSSAFVRRTKIILAF